MRATCIPTVLLATQILLGCQNSRPVVKEPTVPTIGKGWLDFDLKTLTPVTPATELYEGTYSSNGKTARFQIEFQMGKPSGEFRISFGKGRIIAVPGSDSSELLQQLKKTFEATKLPSSVVRTQSISFDVAQLGDKQSHSLDGGFFSNPPGNWRPIKIFLGEENTYSECFLNINTVLHKGEFSIKDPEYGNDLIGELAKVL